MENLSLSISLSTSASSSRDLLQGITSSATRPRPNSEQVNEEKEEVELNLGLSLGGRFGVDRAAGRLLRSSSLATYLPASREGTQAPPAPPPPTQFGWLPRASTLPAEREEEWGKRKEQQGPRRLEAKRMRSEEKQRNQRCGGGGGLSLERDRSLPSVPRPTSSTVGSQSGFTMEIGQGSQGGSMEIKGSSGELSPAINLSLPAASNQDMGSSAARPGPSSVPHVPTLVLEREIRTNTLEEMPCVFTVGDGSLGRIVNGILYKYGKGEEVRIICVCHGCFHSPAEFVRHAGGTDVSSPLRQIIVNPHATPLV